MRYLVIALGIALGYGSYSAFSQSRLDIGIGKYPPASCIASKGGA